MRNKALFIILSILFWGLAAMTIWGAREHFIEHETEHEKARTAKELDIIRFSLESAVLTETYISDSLATIVSLDPQYAIDNWTELGKKLLDKTKYIRNIGLATDNVITEVYPLKGNESTIGFDYRTRPAQLKTVLYAKQQKSVYLAGPLTLFQGGTGLIARFPIFSNFVDNNDYWGVLSVVIDFDLLISETGLNDFKNADIALMKHNIDDNSTHVFYGDKSVFEQPDIEYPIQLPSGQWTMAAKIKVSNLQEIHSINNILLTISFIVVLLLYILLLLLYRDYKYKVMLTLQDELTKIPNRRHIMQLLKKLTADSNASFALLNIDINGFKKINDKLGHEAGDQFIKYVANLLTSETKDHGTAARYGGDEFLIVLENVENNAQVETFINQIREATKSTQFFWHDHEIPLSLSIGSAIFEGEIDTIEKLLSSADKTMYAQKNQGRRKTDRVKPEESKL
ncbi:sensor domain-containing diguanylate cyclase [Psychromonas sp. RZ22]|uniref:diguanylate cyclase domain-containing protein n=1 Tax=Psychromonas algarum TaxID=2555643 RepID=UPI001067465C|nr:diguanylate cyclase [Psychromonas sp. RZ22]TEW55314.1 sensor domain-containing diguanylate cyclase [Psychromonas sp. RZ22]